MNASPSRELDRVDRELRSFWSAPPAPGEAPKARASTRNIIVVAGTAELAASFSAVVDDVLQSIPARAIVVGLDPDGSDALEATTTAVCTPGAGGGPAICSERVTLQARGGVCARMASCVSTLCATDVPTTLIWLGRVHADDLLFAPLARDADRVILDSERGSLSDLAHLARWAAGLPLGERPGVADLAWTRLAPWQELCARMFDEPRLRDLAARVTRVGISQASAIGAPLAPEGALLLAWLATRLRWKTTAFGGKLRLTRLDDGIVRPHLRAETGMALPLGSLLSVDIEASADGVSLAGAIRREPGESDAATWRLEVRSEGDSRRIEQRVRLRASELAPLLERTLHRPAHDHALVDSVAWADGLFGEEVACR